MVSLFHCDRFGTGPTRPPGLFADSLPNWHEWQSRQAVLTAQDKWPVNRISGPLWGFLLASRLRYRTSCFSARDSINTLISPSETKSLNPNLKTRLPRKGSGLCASALWNNYETFPAGVIKALIDIKWLAFQSKSQHTVAFPVALAFQDPLKIVLMLFFQDFIHFSQFLIDVVILFVH